MQRRFHPRHLAALFLSAALMLSGIMFMPYAQHVFWAPEAFATRLLAPLAALALLTDPNALSSLGKASPQRLGSGLLLLWMGCWFLSAGLAPRPDLAGRELSLWIAPPLILVATWQLAGEATMRRRILAVILFAGSLQAIYALVQSAGLESTLAQALGPQAFGFDRLNWAVTYGGRAGAFFGNPNFLGGHLAMLFPLALALAMDGRHRGARRWLGWGVAALIAAGLVASQTRGAWIGAASGTLLLLILCRKKIPGLLTRNRAALGSLLMATLLALGLFVATHAQTLGRLKGMFSGDEEIARRLTLMRCSLQMAQEHPWLGSGPGNFRLLFPSVQSAGLSQDKLRNRPYIVSEHAHNDLIQMAAECGIPAALLMLALILWTYKTIGSAIRQAREVERQSEAPGKPLLLSGILSALLALHVHGLANFPFLIAPTQMTAWALAAIGLRLALPGFEPAQPSEGSPMATRRPWLPWALAGAMILVALNAFDAGRMLMKDALWWRAQGEQSLGHHDLAKPWVAKALQLDPKEDQLWMLQGQAEAALGHYNDAVSSLQRAIQLDEHYDEARVSLGRILVGIHQFAPAEQALSLVALEAPNFKELWEPLGASLYMQGKYDQAVIAYNWASYFDAATAEMLENQAAALGNLNRYQDALLSLVAAENLQPGRAKNYINRAITHYKMGLKVQARMDLDEAARRDPKDPQVAQLRKVLH
jgi:O-antigen ligase/Flp pilus assembly protein TadD